MDYSDSICTSSSKLTLSFNQIAAYLIRVHLSRKYASSMIQLKKYNWFFEWVAEKWSNHVIFGDFHKVKFYYATGI